MCGILCVLSSRDINPNGCPGLLQLLDHRGPDVVHSCLFDIKTEFNDYKAIHSYFRGSVLSLRPPLTKQPIESSGNYLLFNGEIYRGIDTDNRNDVEALSDILIGSDGSFSGFLSILTRINAEFSLIYYHKANNILWFCRDAIGRRSLVINRPTAEIGVDDTLIISSVAHMDCIDQTSCAVWSEIPAGYLFKLDFKNRNDFSKALTYQEMSFLKPQLFKDIDFQSETQICEEFLRQLERSVKIRVSENSLGVCPPSLALLFSGGIDCTLLAVIIAKCISAETSVELINVSFFDTKRSPSTSIDRISAQKAFEWLRSQYLGNKWSFLEVNISVEELNECRTRIIRELIFPRNSNLDDSLGCPLWFACRGLGEICDKSLDDGEPLSKKVKITSRVIISGLGADEIMCGYDRYFKMFQEHDCSFIAREVIKDIQTLQSRNLGRDDRCCSDHGKELRFPYLDENLVNFCINIPIPFNIDVSKPRGVGNKLILRKSARIIGIPETICNKPKKAFQYGSQFIKINKNRPSLS